MTIPEHPLRLTRCGVLSANTEFDGYRLLAPLGQGGMGQVWRALDIELDRQVAIKLVLDARPDRPTRERFRVEARALARIQHPNVVAVYRTGEVDGQPYLVYELVAGRSLDQIAAAGGTPWEEVLPLGLDLARGLAAAHAAGVLHRDLKPANVMRTAAGVGKLIDFGLAKVRGSGPDGVASPRVAAAPRAEALDDELTRSGALLGTPRYLAPEIWRGQAADAGTDLYALGLILWELLAGAPAFGDRRGAAALVEAVLHEPLPSVGALRPDLPFELASLVDRAVRKDPGERFRSAEELYRALEAAAGDIRAIEAVSTNAALAAAPTEEDAALVRASLARALAAPNFALRLYERLFARHPELRPLFPAALGGLARKLAEALHAAVASLREPARLRPMLEELGARHRLYGVREEDLDSVRDALLEHIAEVEGDRLEGALLLAWQRAWRELEAPFREGMRRPAPASSAPAPVQALEDVTRDLSAPDTRPVAPPSTRYAWVDDVSVAYQTFGRGEVDLLVAPAWISHCEVSWRLPALERFLRRLGERARVTFFDKRGTGMSDRMNVEMPVEERMRDLPAVLDAIGARSAVLLGVQDGAALAAAFAACHPERVRALVLYGSGRRLVATQDYPHGIPPAVFEQACAAIQTAWGAPLFAEFAAPSRAADPAFLEWWADYLRHGASPGTALSLFRLNATCDVDPALPAVSAPTLVIHRQGDRMMPVGGGRYVASRVPGARYLELPGDDHLPWIGDADAIAGAIERFLDEAPAAPARRSALVTALCVQPAEGAGAAAAEALAAAAGRAPEAREGALCVEPRGPVAAIRAALSLRRCGLLERAAVHVGSRAEGEPPAVDPALVALAALRRLPSGAIGATGPAEALSAGGGVALAGRVPGGPGEPDLAIIEGVRPERMGAGLGSGAQ